MRIEITQCSCELSIVKSVNCKGNVVMVEAYLLSASHGIGGY